MFTREIMEKLEVISSKRKTFADGNENKQKKFKQISDVKPFINKLKKKDYFNTIEKNGSEHQGKTEEMQTFLKKRKFTKKLKEKQVSQFPKAKFFNKEPIEKITNQQSVIQKKPKLEELKKKQRKQLRKKSSNNYDLITKSKQLWEMVRRHDCNTDKREQLTKELFHLIKGKIKQLIFAHDTVRVIECLVAIGTQEQRNYLFQELQDSLLELSKSKYGKFFVQKMLKYGSREQRNCIISSFQGHVRKIIRHSEAADILEYAFNDFCNATQRATLLKEFYGASYAVFNDEVKGLNQLLEEEPNKKEMILKHMKDCLLPLIDKSVIRHSMVHKVLRDYLNHASSQMKTEMIEALRESCVSILHTNDGARVVCICLWHGTAKDRKVIIKSLKTHVTKVCKEEHGHMILLALFDVIDDTKLVQKIILEEIKQNLKQIIQDVHGRKVLFYLLSPRDPLHFHPDIVKILEMGDNNQQSKKNKELRQNELLQWMSGPLLELVASDAKDILFNNSINLLMIAVLTHAKGNPKEAFEAISKIACHLFTPGGNHIVDHPMGHILLKRLILNDKVRVRQQESILFSEMLLAMLPGGALESWMYCNRGAFVVCSFLETEIPNICQQVNAELKNAKKLLKKMKFKGAEILLKKLS